MKSVVIGGTAGVGREIATALAAKGHCLLITGKDMEDVEACTMDLRLRYGVEVQGITVDASNSTDFIRELGLAAIDFGEINYLFLTIGASNNEDNGDLQIEKAIELLSSNFLAIVMAEQIFRHQYVKSEPTGVIGFSSVAAIRGRNKNVIYAASKRALESYFESLKLISQGANFSVQIYRLGFIDTYQAYGQRLPFPKANPKKVAKMVVRRLDAVSGISYYPRYWRFIAIVVKIAPLRIFKKINS
jgi:short-subunit dehydrogenase